MSSRVARLEDFGIRGTVAAAERLREYRRQCRGLSRRLQARFWLDVVKRDREVARLVRDDGQGITDESHTNHRRVRKWRQRTRR